MTAVWKSRHDDLVSDGVVAPHAFDPMVVPDCGVVLTRCNSIKSAVDAGRDELAVLGRRGARARALPGVGQERAFVLAGDTKGAVVVLLDRPRAHARVGCPNVLLTGAVVRHDHEGGEAAVPALGLPLPARIGEARGCERQDAGE